MSITTASGRTRAASSTASRPLRARAATENRGSASSAVASASRKDSSSSATSIRYRLGPPKQGQPSQGLPGPPEREKTLSYSQAATDQPSTRVGDHSK